MASEFGLFGRIVKSAKTFDPEIREILDFTGIVNLMATFDAEEKFSDALARDEI